MKKIDNTCDIVFDPLWEILWDKLHSEVSHNVTDETIINMFNATDVSRVWDSDFYIISVQ